MGNSARNMAPVTWLPVPREPATDEEREFLLAAGRAMRDEIAQSPGIRHKVRGWPLSGERLAEVLNSHARHDGEFLVESHPRPDGNGSNLFVTYFNNAAD